MGKKTGDDAIAKRIVIPVTQHMADEIDKARWEGRFENLSETVRHLICAGMRGASPGDAGAEEEVKVGYKLAAISLKVSRELHLRLHQERICLGISLSALLVKMIDAWFAKEGGASVDMDRRGQQFLLRLSDDEMSNLDDLASEASKSAGRRVPKSEILRAAIKAMSGKGHG
jgi:hypothetical protein